VVEASGVYEREKSRGGYPAPGTAGARQLFPQQQKTLEAARGGDAGGAADKCVRAVIVMVEWSRPHTLLPGRAPRSRGARHRIASDNKLRPGRAPPRSCTLRYFAGNQAPARGSVPPSENRLQSTRVALNADLINLPHG